MTTAAAAVRAYLFNSELRALESFCYSLSLTLFNSSPVVLFFLCLPFLSFSLLFRRRSLFSFTLKSRWSSPRLTYSHSEADCLQSSNLSLSVAQQPLFPSFLLSPKCENVPLLGCWLSVCVVLTETLDCCGVLRSLFALELELPPLYE